MGDRLMRKKPEAEVASHLFETVCSYAPLELGLSDKYDLDDSFVVHYRGRNYRVQVTRTTGRSHREKV